MEIFEYNNWYNATITRTNNDNVIDYCFEAIKMNGGMKMDIKENKCDKCKYRWEMNKEHCNKCKNNPDNAPERKGEPDNFEEKNGD